MQAHSQILTGASGTFVQFDQLYAVACLFPALSQPLDALIQRIKTMLKLIRQIIMNYELWWLKLRNCLAGHSGVKQVRLCHTYPFQNLVDARLNLVH